MAATRCSPNTPRDWKQATIRCRKTLGCECGPGCGGCSARRRAARRIIDRETAGCIDFDAALEAYLNGGDPEELLRAAGMVIGSIIALDPEHALVLTELTGCTCELVDYDDAGRAVRRWFATMAEPGARH
jgi:hypothetical protein